MATCITCGAEINREDPPRYDVLRPGLDLDDLSDAGPYCEADFANTVTGQSMTGG